MRFPLERAYAPEIVRDLVALPGVVVPVELARLLALGELVRAVAERLVLRQPALAQPDLPAVDRVAGRFLRGASDEACHAGSFYLMTTLPRITGCSRQM